MTRAARLAAMIAALSEGRPLGLAKLQERFGRNAAVDLSDLVTAGWPVEGDDAAGYAMVRTAMAEQVVLAEGEVNMLRRGAAGLEGRDAAVLTALLSRFQPVFMAGMDVDSIAASVLDRGQVAAARFLPSLRQAVRRRVRVGLAYADREGRESRREVRPLDLERRGAGWALVAWCEMRGDFRQFRLDRVLSVETGEPFPWEPARELWTFRLYHRNRD